jgi:hypothetical protein
LTSCFGGEEEDRTPDLCIANAALSQLSYFPETLAPDSCPNGIRIIGRAGGRFKRAGARARQYTGFASRRTHDA